MHDVAVMVAQHLDLNMPGRLDVLFEVDAARPEGSFRLAGRGLEQLRQLLRVPDNAHPATAASGDGLDHDGIPQLLGHADGLLVTLHRPVASGQNGHAGFLHGPSGTGLVTHEPNDIRIRPDEPDVAGLADLGQVGALGQEAIPGVDGVGARNLGRTDDRRHVEVAVEAPGRTDTHVLVGEPDMQRVLVRLGVHGDGLDAELAARADHPKGDLTAVRNQDLVEHAFGTGSGTATLLDLDREQALPELHGAAVVHVDGGEFTVAVALDLVHELHGFDDAQDLPLPDGVPHLDERPCARFGRP